MLERVCFECRDVVLGLQAHECEKEQDMLEILMQCKRCGVVMRLFDKVSVFSVTKLNVMRLARQTCPNCDDHAEWEIVIGPESTGVMA